MGNETTTTERKVRDARSLIFTPSLGRGVADTGRWQRRYVRLHLHWSAADLSDTSSNGQGLSMPDLDPLLDSDLSDIPDIPKDVMPMLHMI